MSQQPKEKRLQRKIKVLENKLGYSNRKLLSLKHENETLRSDNEQMHETIHKGDEACGTL